MEQTVAEIVENAINNVVENLGYDIVEVKYASENEGMVLTIYIDKLSGVSLDDCEKVHNAVDAILDEVDPTNGASYSLSISSSGLQRPLVNKRDFERKVGTKLELTLKQPVEKKNKLIAKLIEVRGDELALGMGNETINIKLCDIAKAVVYF